jgi:uncharacterized protein YdeI (YjbR/CyaY-like superfamily)
MATLTPPPNSIHPLTLAEWRAWLEQNHMRSEGVWLITYKKATGKSRFEYDEAVKEALCFGWIDSKPNKLDEERSILAMLTSSKPILAAPLRCLAQTL